MSSRGAVSTVDPERARELRFDLVEAAKRINRHSTWAGVASASPGVVAHHAAVLCQLAGRLRQLADTTEAIYAPLADTAGT